MKRFPFLLIAFSMGGLVGGCGRSDIGQAPPEVAQKAVKEQADQAKNSVSSVKELTVRGGKLEGADSQGRPLWRLQAKVIKSSGASLGDETQPQTATLLDAKAALFRAGKIESTFSAKHMTLFQAAKSVRITMRDGVTARSAALASGGQGPVEIQAPRADVDVDKRIVAASGGVTVKHLTTTLKGPSMRAQTTLASVEMNNGVSVLAPQATVTAKRATFDWKTDYLKAQGVTATRQGTVITGQLLQANTSASRGVLSGNVTAKAPQGTAHAPRLDFDWGRDRIIASGATLSSPDGTLTARQLRTDSKLKVAQASGVTVSKQGAILTASSATGFDSLTHLSGTGVTLRRGDLFLTAGTVQAANWSQRGGRINGGGGVIAKNSTGTVRARSAVVSGNNSVEATGGVQVQTGGIVARADQANWSGGANGIITANGHVQIQGHGALVRARSGQSDSKFQNATLNGNVRATLPDGSQVSAPSLQKRGDKVFASDATALMRSRGAGPISLRAAKVEASFDGSTATASGGVTMRSASGTTVTAPRAVYDRKAQSITATGGVLITDKARGLTQRGDTLRADLSLKQFTIDNVRGQSKGNLFEGKKLF